MILLCAFVKSRQIINARAANNSENRLCHDLGAGKWPYLMIELSTGRLARGPGQVKRLTPRGLRRMKSLKPFDEVSDAVFQRRVWAKADSALELRAVGKRFKDVAGLQRKVFSDRRPANGLLDQAHQFVDFHGLTIANIVKERRRLNTVAHGLACRSDRGGRVSSRPTASVTSSM